MSILKKLYNKMVDTIVDLRKQNRKSIYSSPIEFPSFDVGLNPSIQTLRAFVRSYMTKSDNFVKSKYPEM